MQSVPTKHVEGVYNSVNFVGNRPKKALDLIGPDKKTLRQQYNIGEPIACHEGTVEQMKKKGFVGIYYKPKDTQSLVEPRRSHVAQFDRTC